MRRKTTALSVGALCFTQQLDKRELVETAHRATSELSRTDPLETPRRRSGEGPNLGTYIHTNTYELPTHVTVKDPMTEHGTAVMPIRRWRKFAFRAPSRTSLWFKGSSSSLMLSVVAFSTGCCAVCHGGVIESVN